MQEYVTTWVNSKYIHDIQIADIKWFIMICGIKLIIMFINQGKFKEQNGNLIY